MCGVVEGDSFLIFRIETWANDMSVFETNILSQFCDLNSAIVHKMETILLFAVLLLAFVNLLGEELLVLFEEVDFSLGPFSVFVIGGGLLRLEDYLKGFDVATSTGTGTSIEELWCIPQKGLLLLLQSDTGTEA